MDFEVVCYGTICQDRVMRIPRFPAGGSSVWIQEDEITLGGEAANSSAALSRWGVRTLLLGTVLGADERRDWLLGKLAGLEHVDSSQLTSEAGAKTPYCMIFATPDGERTMFGRHFDVMRGQSVTDLPKASIFTLDPYCGEAAVEAAGAARRAGMKIIAMDALGHPEIMRLCDMIVTSHQEVAPNAPVDKIEEIASRSARDCGRTTIVTMGERGSVAASPDGDILHRQQTLRVGAVVDATGCGDAYRAGLVCGAARGWDIKKSMAFASAAAALNLQGLGGAGFILPLHETLNAAESIEP